MKPSEKATLFKMCQKLVELRMSRVCVHNVALDIVGMLKEDCGASVPDRLFKTLTDASAGDAESAKILEELIEEAQREAEVLPEGEDEQVLAVFWKEGTEHLEPTAFAVRSESGFPSEEEDRYAGTELNGGQAVVASPENVHPLLTSEDFNTFQQARYGWLAEEAEKRRERMLELKKEYS